MSIVEPKTRGIDQNGPIVGMFSFRKVIRYLWGNNLNYYRKENLRVNRRVKGREKTRVPPTYDTILREKLVSSYKMSNTLSFSVYVSSQSQIYSLSPYRLVFTLTKAAVKHGKAVKRTYRGIEYRRVPSYPETSNSRLG